ncbi:hypothetical protein [Streptomyces avermitilis]
MRTTTTVPIAPSNRRTSAGQAAPALAVIVHQRGGSYEPGMFAAALN